MDCVYRSYMNTETNRCGIYREGNGVTGVTKPCDKEYLVPIDVNIVAVVSLLNAKGYKTSFCCEGHISFPIDSDVYCIEYFEYPYILFHPDVVLPNIPKNWTKYVDENCDGILQEGIYAMSLKEAANLVDFQMEKLKALYYLYKWARHLPKYKEIGADYEKS